MNKHPREEEEENEKAASSNNNEIVVEGRASKLLKKIKNDQQALWLCQTDLVRSLLKKRSPAYLANFELATEEYGLSEKALHEFAESGVVIKLNRAFPISFEHPGLFHILFRKHYTGVARVIYWKEDGEIILAPFHGATTLGVERSIYPIGQLNPKDSFIGDVQGKVLEKRQTALMELERALYEAQHDFRKATIPDQLWSLVMGHKVLTTPEFKVTYYNSGWPKSFTGGRIKCMFKDCTGQMEYLFV
jgi:hypothetical protein